MKSILIIEDDQILNHMLSFHLSKNGINADSVYTYEDAYDKINSELYDLIILDCNLNTGSGYDLCTIIKSKTRSVVVFLTAKDLESDILHGYDLGADDYITKPFSLDIFIKKIMAIMCRIKNIEKDSIFFDDFLMLNFTSFIASINNSEVSLTPLEFKILKQLFDNANQILTRQTIIERLWDIDEKFVDENALTVGISRIRRKIEVCSRKYIKTIYSVGYMWIGEKFETKR